jgi:hypothetical protein
VARKCFPDATTGTGDQDVAHGTGYPACSGEPESSSTM